MQNDNLKKSGSQTFLKGAMVLSISMIIVKLCGMVYKIMLTKIYAMFGDQYAGIGTGIFSNAYEIYIPLFTLATAGFPIAVSRLISESIAKERYKDVRQIHRVSKPFFVIMGLVSFSLMIGLSFIYVDVVKSPYSIYSLMMLAPSIFFGCIVSIYRGYFEGHRNMVPTAISEIVEACVKMILGLSLAYLVMKVGMNQYQSSGSIFGLTFGSETEAMNTLIGFSVASAIFAISLGGFFSYIALKIIYKRRKNDIPEEYYENSVDALSRKETLINLVKTAIPIGLAALVMSISSSIDTIIIQKVLYNMALTDREALLAQFDGHLDANIPLNPTASNPITIHTYLMGAFSCALTVMQLITAVTQVFGTSAMPSVTNAYTKGDKDELKKSIETVLKLTMLVTLPAGIGMFVLPYPIISLLYDGYVASVAAGVLRVMGISVIFVAVSTPICSMLQGVGRVDLPLKIYCIAMVIKLTTNYVFVNIVEINIVGGAVGSLVAFLFVCVVGMYFLVKNAKVVPDFMHTVLKPLLGSIICGAAAYVVYYAIESFISGALATLISIGVAAVVYVVSLLLLHTFTENEIKMLPKGKNVVTILAKLHLLR
ncbi:MAG: polysaccharide biosynthesis protein [Ruminococcus sp.]|nr:polysaccharide biosynthesis protein [Ruminococcus sp.]